MRIQPATLAVLAAATLAALTTACAGSLDLTPSDAATVLSGHHLDHPNPALPGPHKVLTLYYGSGTDRNRAEYRDSVSIVTQPVDASKLVSLGNSAKSRNKYWGFSPDSFPINARVWYPTTPVPTPSSWSCTATTTCATSRIPGTTGSGSCSPAGGTSWRRWT